MQTSVTPMSRFRRLTPRIAIVGGLVVYLITDFSVHGPIARSTALLRPGSADSIAKARAEGVIARVHGHPIHRSQLQRVVLEKSCSEKQALEELIDAELLRHEAGENEGRNGLAVSTAEVDEAFRRFSLKFETPESLASALRAEGFSSESEFRRRLHVTLLQEKFIESRIASDVGVRDDESREWFGKHAAELATPERLQARQVFLATLDREPAEAKQKLEAALADLSAGKKDFAALVAELSEDEGSKPRSGDLGWMTRDRLPADFVLPVFGLEQGKPALIRSKLGWHLVEVTARKLPAEAEFESLKPEIFAALTAVKKNAAIATLRNQLRQEAVGKIEIFQND